MSKLRKMKYIDICRRWILVWKQWNTMIQQEAVCSRVETRHIDPPNSGLYLALTKHHIRNNASMNTLKPSLVAVAPSTNSVCAIMSDIVKQRNEVLWWSLDKLRPCFKDHKKLLTAKTKTHHDGTQTPMRTLSNFNFLMFYSRCLYVRCGDLQKRQTGGPTVKLHGQRFLVRDF